MAGPAPSNIAVPYLDVAVGTPAPLLVGRRPAASRLAHALTASLPHAPPVSVGVGAAPAPAPPSNG